MKNETHNLFLLALGFILFIFGAYTGDTTGQIIGSVWIACSVILGRLESLSKRKQIGGDKMTITIEADNTQAIKALEEVRAAAEKTADAVKKAEGKA